MRKNNRKLNLAREFIQNLTTIDDRRLEGVHGGEKAETVGRPCSFSCPDNTCGCASMNLNCA
jgi:hypothetical protein